MPRGLVKKAYSNFFDVVLLESSGGGLREGTVVEAQLPGRFRREELSVFTGDRVVVSISVEEGTVPTVLIEKIEPRSSKLFRPPIANVDQVILVFTLTNPPFNPSLLDRQLVLAEAELLPVVMCLNKLDLTLVDRAERVRRLYQDIGYEVLLTSAKTGEGIEELKEILSGYISVFAGQSGVGKSRLINCLDDDFELELGEVSERLGRGRHTTRHVELLSLDNAGWVADTPGFNRLELHHIAKEELAFCFPEFEELIPRCKFANCLHDQEPGCAVKAAVQDGTVHKRRYKHYLELLNEIREWEASRFR